MPRLQELIHALEVGAGARYLRIFALVLGVAAIALTYNLREFQNLRSEEAMDAAQLARNIAEGRGFTTRYVRPLSMGVVMNHRQDRDPQVKGEHPDLVNPPLYPLILAGFMKIPGLFDFAIPSTRETPFRRYEPDFIIAMINEGFFFIAILLVYRLASRLFDQRVGLVTTLVLLGGDVFWQFNVSGQATMLALALFMAVANLVHSIEVGARRTPPASLGATVGLAAAAGLLCGLLTLTRYSLGVVVIPLLVFLATGMPGRRLFPPIAAALVFLAVLSPWVVRNAQVSGNPFGLAPYSLVQETATFAENWLERVPEPEISKVRGDDIVRKLSVGAGLLVREELPQLGGSWLTGLFLAGLLLPFVNPARTRFRWWTLGTLVVVALAQILARTHLSTDTPRINSENLLIILAPLVFMFGTALVILLVYSLDVAAEVWRTVILGAVVCALWLPLAITFGPPRTFPIAYPPYYPPTIQRVAQWFEPGEWIMTDMPWAVAWYGDRQALLLSRSPDKEFLDISDWHKSVHGVYLTRITLDQKFLSGWVLNARQWGRFIIEILTRGEVPKGFPLRRSPSFMTTFPDHLLLSDRIRWQDTTGIAPPKGLELRDPEKIAAATAKTNSPQPGISPPTKAPARSGDTATNVPPAGQRAP